MARALDDGAESVELRQGTALPEGVDTIASALPGNAGAWLVDAAVEQGIAIATVTEDSDALAVLDTAARAQVRLASSRDAASRRAFPTCWRVTPRARSTASTKCTSRASASPATRASVPRAAAQREPVVEWRDGALVSERGHGAELIWFPDPVGARECELVSAGIEQLVAAVSGVRHGVGPPRAAAHAAGEVARPVQRARPGAAGSRCRVGRGARRSVGIA